MADYSNILFSLYSGASGVLSLVIPIIVFGVIGFLLIKFDVIGSYPIDVTIFEIRGGSTIEKADKAKKVKKKDGTEEYKLKKAKTTIKPPKFEDYITKEKKFLGIIPSSRAHLFLKSLTHGSYEILKPNFADDKKDFEDADENISVRFWKTTEDKRADIRWQSKKFNMEKMLPILTLAICIIMLVVFLWGYSEYILRPIGGQTTANIAKSEDLIETASKLLEKSVLYLEASGAVIIIEGNKTVIK